MQISKAIRIADALISNGVTVQNHGKWVKTPSGFVEYICSVCFGLSGVDDRGKAIRTRYCPHCGSLMGLD